MKVIDQPEWVCTMDDNIEHYKKPKSHFLKNVVYKDSDDRLIIAVMRGDLEANPAKISNLLGCGPLELADDDDLASMNTKSGWVHSWGHKEDREDVIYVGDIALKKSRNLIGGKKEKTTDTINVNYGRDFECDAIGDIAEAAEGSKCKHCDQGYLKEKKGIEVGHIFKYDHYYTEPHQATFVDKDGKEKPMWMGAYGIGIGRALATVVEMHNDEHGVVWPVSVAPYHVHIVGIGQSDEVAETAQQIHNFLEENGIEVLWDDREEASVGVKFADADLIGVPIRMVVSQRSLKNNEIEIKMRSEDDEEMIENDNEKILKRINELLAN
jgi:prolyl-tRNA synthetase